MHETCDISLHFPTFSASVHLNLCVQPKNHRITEQLKKGPLVVLFNNFNAQAGSDRSGCPGSWPVAFWLSLQTEIPQPLWETCWNWPPSQKKIKIKFLYSGGISCLFVLICDHSLFHVGWYYGEESCSLFFLSSHQILILFDDIPLKASPGWAFFVCQILQFLSHLRGFAWDSAKSKSLLQWGAQNWIQYSRCGLTSTE